MDARRIFGGASSLPGLANCCGLLALTALAALTSFCAALVLRRPFEACLAAAVLPLIVGLLVLRAERDHLFERLAAVAGAAASSRTATPVPQGPAPLSEWEALLSEAGSLGPSQVYLAVLGKEYLRCATALQRYRAAVGPLEGADPWEEPAVHLSGAPVLTCTGTVLSEHLLLGDPVAREEFNRAGSIDSLLKLDNIREDGQRATPKSPQGLNSPEHQRRLREGLASPMPRQGQPDGAAESSGPSPRTRVVASV